jgi:hypothetical protein
MANTGRMEQVSQQVIQQRYRNRFMEMFELHSSIEGLARWGIDETLLSIDELAVGLRFEAAPHVFDEKEQALIAEYLKLAKAAEDANDLIEDTWKVAWFESKPEWVELSKCAQKANSIFSKRGHFSESFEEDNPI